MKKYFFVVIQLLIFMSSCLIPPSDDKSSTNIIEKNIAEYKPVNGFETIIDSSKYTEVPTWKTYSSKYIYFQYPPDWTIFPEDESFPTKSLGKEGEGSIAILLNPPMKSASDFSTTLTISIARPSSLHKGLNDYYASNESGIRRVENELTILQSVRVKKPNYEYHQLVYSSYYNGKIMSKTNYYYQYNKTCRTLFRCEEKEFAKYSKTLDTMIVSIRILEE